MTKMEVLKNTAFGVFMAGTLAFPAAVYAAGTSASTGVTQTHFSQADADRSGTLTDDEYEAFADAQEDAGIDVASDFDDLDTNDDDALTVAEFTAQPLFGPKVRGLHATMLMESHQYTIICQTSESQFDALKPAFMQVIDSITPWAYYEERFGPVE